MTEQQPDGRFVFLDDAVRLFKASREEIREACEEHRVRAVYIAENDENAIRVCLEDLRKHFEELGEPEEANQLARWGRLVAKGSAAIIGAKVVDMAAGGALEQAWEFLSGFIFRSLPAPSRTAPEGVESAIAVETGESRPTSVVGDRALRPGRDYQTRQGGSSGFVTRQGGGGGHVTRQGGGGPIHRGGVDGGSRGRGVSRGGAMGEGGRSGGFQAR